MAMDKKIKKKWLSMLRSGRYKQSNALLRTGVGHEMKYCCLGVLCRAVGAKASEDTGFMFNGDDPQFGKLSVRLLKHVGITPKQEDCLIDLNDTQRKSFKEIADYVENYL